MPKGKNVIGYEAALKEFRKLAKVADERLRQIKQNYSKREGFQNIENWAYQKAMRDIAHWSGEGKHTFNRDVPKTLKGLKAKTRDIQDFLQAPTSTITGTKEMFQDRADKLNEKWGTDFTWEQLGDVFENKEENVIYQRYGGSYLKAVSYLQSNEDRIMKQLMSGDHVTVRTGNRKANQAVNALLDEYGIQFNELY